MAKQRGQRKGSGWLRQQAVAEKDASARKRAARTEKQVQEQQAKDALTKLIQQTVQQQARLQRLAVAFADRCWRVHALYGLLRPEWERAEAAEGRVRQLENELRALKAPARKAAAPKPGTKPVRNGRPTTNGQA